jgi:tetratricopeptide (TPR) repeat protein
LRDLGVGTVVQSGRLADARRKLEESKFDVVLCEHRFANDVASGQDLLDDLRRNQLLPYSTVFIMITSEATYSMVTEAAESALDGYLIKPHKAMQLDDRLRQARLRKVTLKDIFEAIEVEEFGRAARLCVERFENRSLFWLYSARVGAELLLRLGSFDKAQALYEAVIVAKDLPWAHLGVARSLLEAGQTSAAISALEALIQNEPAYADAYDVLGRAQFESAQFDRALLTYRQVSQRTPASITRLQSLGMVMFYFGDRVEAEKVLDQATRLGLDSKMFDCQTLVLMAFERLASNDRKGLQRCVDDFKRLQEKNDHSPRYRRLNQTVATLLLVQQQQLDPVVDAVRAMAEGVTSDDFDFEAATNLLYLLTLLAQRAMPLKEANDVLDAIGMRFCTSRALTDLLAHVCDGQPTYAERLRECQPQVAKLIEGALKHSVNGNPKGAVQNLIKHSQATLNSKLVETAFLVLQRYAESIADPQDLITTVTDLRTRYCTGVGQPSLGERKRKSGGLTLRTATRPVASKAAA